MNERLPTGQNPLEQLVLIIADGRLHEKENLKRCFRDILVAFLLLGINNRSLLLGSTKSSTLKKERMLALLGAASFLGGSMRITVSLALCYYGGNYTQLKALTSYHACSPQSKVVGDAFNQGLYEEQARPLP